jgi:hypothetical protein
MNTPEHQVSEEEVVREELELVHGDRSPKDLLQLQFPLAFELYRIDHPNARVDERVREDRNAVMEYWGVSGYSKYFRQYAEAHPERGLKISLEDIAEWSRGVAAAA